MQINVEMNQLDDLHESTLELDMLTYLQGLVYHDEEQRILIEDDFTHVRSYTHMALWERQLKTARQVREQLYHILFAKEMGGSD